MSSRRRPVWVGMAVAALVLAVAQPAAAYALSASNVKKVPVTKWATLVCRDFGRWEGTISATTVADPAADPVAAKAAFSTFVTDAIAATDALSRRLNAAGIPDVKHGKAIASSFVASVATSRRTYEEVLADVAQLPTTDATAFRTAAKNLAARLLTAGTALNQSLQQLANRDRVHALDKAFRSAKTCKDAATT